MKIEKSKRCLLPAPWLAPRCWPSPAKRKTPIKPLRRHRLHRRYLLSDGRRAGNVWSNRLKHGDTGHRPILRRLDREYRPAAKDEAQLAILQSLIAVEAYQGVRNFDGRAYGDLRSISMLWPNVEHFVMLESRVKDGTLNDIAGTRFSVGPQASGTEQSTMIILQGVNLTKKSLSAEYLGYGDTVSAMRDGRTDGGALPAGCRPPPSPICMPAACRHASRKSPTNSRQHQRHRQLTVPLRHQGGDLPAPARRSPPSHSPIFWWPSAGSMKSWCTT